MEPLGRGRVRGGARICEDQSDKCGLGSAAETWVKGAGGGREHVSGFSEVTARVSFPTRPTHLDPPLPDARQAAPALSLASHSRSR